jgi:hypothetical protein
MRGTPEQRIAKLEASFRSRQRRSMVFRWGPIRHLPPGTLGDRCIAIAKSEPTALPSVQRCEFEERMGMAAEVEGDLTFSVYLTVDDNSSQCSSRTVLDEAARTDESY